MPVDPQHNAKRALPSDLWLGWLEEFRDWVLPTTDAGEAAIFAAGLLTLGCAIGRQVRVHYGRALYPNFYVVLLGATGITRKSTVTARGRDVLAQAFSPDFLRFAKSVGSAEGLLELFCNERVTGEGKNQRTIFGPVPGQRVLLDEPEFTGLFVKMGRPGTANLLEILLTLYDAENYKPATRSRPVEVVEPFFCVLTTTTPQMLETRLADIHLSSGLLSRFAFFEPNPRQPMAYPDPPDPGGLDRLARGLQEIFGYAGQLGRPLILSPEARCSWEPVFQSFTYEHREADRAPAYLLTRIPGLAMKVALVYAVMRRHKVIETDDVEAGAAVAAYCADVTKRMPLSAVPASRHGRLDERILAHLDNEWKSASAIHRALGGRVGAEELRRELAALIEIGRIDRQEVRIPRHRYAVYRRAGQEPTT